MHLGVNTPQWLRLLHPHTHTSHQQDWVLHMPPWPPGACGLGDTIEFQIEFQIHAYFKSNKTNPSFSSVTHISPSSWPLSSTVLVILSPPLLGFLHPQLPGSRSSGCLPSLLSPAPPTTPPSTP